MQDGDVDNSVAARAAVGNEAAADSDLLLIVAGALRRHRSSKMEEALVRSPELADCARCTPARSAQTSSSGTSPPNRRRIASGGLNNHIWYIVTSHMRAKHAADAAPDVIVTAANGW